MTIFAVLLISVWALADIMTKQNADAQRMGPNNPRMTAASNMSSSMMKPSQNITSSINLMDIIHQAIGSKVNVSLSDAATTAEASVGNGSHAVAAHIDDKNGYLVYQITVIDPSMNFSKVIVDPGNGQVLLSKQVSKADMMKDEMERHHKMMSMMMGGPQQNMGMMMGPQHGREMMIGPMNQGMMIGSGRHDMMMGPSMMRQDMTGPHQGRGMMMGPIAAQAQQADNITSSNATSVLPTTNATTNATSPPVAVVPS